MKHPRSDRGSTLVVATGVSVIMMGLGMVSLSVSMSEGAATDSGIVRSDVLFLFEAAVNLAIGELNTGKDFDGNGVGNVRGTLDGGRYGLVATPLDVNRFHMDVVARKHGILRAVQVVVVYKVPIPMPGYDTAAGFSLLGPIGRSAKFEIDVRRRRSDPGNPEIVMSGFDAAGTRPDLPAIGIEDDTTFARIADQVARDMERGRLSPDSIVGDPMNDIGRGQSASLVNQGPANLDAADLYTLADKIVAAAESRLIPAATPIEDGTIEGNVTWGTPQAPEIRVLNRGRNLVLRRGATLTGAGVLIVQDDLRIKEGATLNWTGTVIVMGNREHNAALWNHDGNLNVNGNIFVIAGGGDEGNARLVLDNEARRDPAPTTTINGNVLIMSGNRERHPERSVFVAHNGMTTINGVLTMVGERIRFDVHTPDRPRGGETGLTLAGGFVAAVPEEADPTRFRFHLAGEDILVNYDSVQVDRAIQQLATFARKYMPDVFRIRYSVAAWREGSPAKMGYGPTGGNGLLDLSE